MAKLKFWRTAPPGDWKYAQPQTRLTIRADSGDELVQRVIEHRKHKGFEPTDYDSVRADIERQICTRLGKQDCRAEGIADEWVPIEAPTDGMFNISAMLGFSKAALAFIASGGKLVSKEELAERHEICSTCPLNTRVPGCKCGLFYKMIDATVPKERKYDDLHVCAACACSINAKAQLPIEAVRTSNEGRDLRFPAYCWQLASHEGNASSQSSSEGG